MDAPETTNEVTTEEEFAERLGELVYTAYEKGVDIEGGWECRNSSEDPDWAVLILEVTKKDAGDE